MPARDDAAVDEPWHALYWRAFDALRFDRQYGALGGETPISYLAISRYAEDHGIGGEDIHLFHQFVVAIDDEWLDHRAEQARIKAA